MWQKWYVWLLGCAFKRNEYACPWLSRFCWLANDGGAGAVTLDDMLRMVELPYQSWFINVWTVLWKKNPIWDFINCKSTVILYNLKKKNTHSQLSYDTMLRSYQLWQVQFQNCSKWKICILKSLQYNKSVLFKPQNFGFHRDSSYCYILPNTEICHQRWDATISKPKISGFVTG